MSSFRWKLLRITWASGTLSDFAKLEGKMKGEI
jgi:hypothetical protein